MVILYKPYYTGIVKVLCMETPIRDIIIGNIPGVLGVEPRCQVNRVNRTVIPGINDTHIQKMKKLKIIQSHQKLTLN